MQSRVQTGSDELDRCNFSLGLQGQQGTVLPQELDCPIDLLLHSGPWSTALALELYT